MNITSIFLPFLSAITALSSNSYPLNENNPESYNSQKQVPIFVGRVEKDHPFEYFDHTSLPICDFFAIEHSKLAHISDTLGTRLVGHHWVFDPRLPVIFGQNLEETSVCKLSITTDVMREASTLVKEGAKVTYWIDGLPTVGYLGLERSGSSYLYKHRHFDITVRDDKIVAVEVIPSQPQQLILNGRFEMTYSVKFTDAETLISSAYDNTPETRYERYLSMSAADATNKTRVDKFNLINAAGFTVILGSLSGLIFQKFIGEAKVNNEESSWSVTSRIPNISVLRNQVYRRPLHAVLISVLIALGAQSIASTLAFWMYTSLFLSKGDMVFKQLDGRIVDAMIGCFLGAAALGGAAGGNFVKTWGIRRSMMAFSAQIGLPFAVATIVIIQYRTVSMMVGTTLAWRFTDCLFLVGIAMINAVVHLIGFVAGSKISSTLETNTPEDIGSVAQVAEAPANGRFARGVLLSIPALLANAILAGPLFYALSCAITSYCVQDDTNMLFLHVFCTELLLASAMIITAYLLLCLGDGRWQWNAARTGVIHGLTQMVLFSIWLFGSGTAYSLYGKAYAIGINAMLGVITCCISTTICYYSSSLILLTIYDGKKAE